MEENKDILDGKDIIKAMWRFFKIVMLVIICFCIGTFVGRHQAKDWSVTKVHHSQEFEGYKYCPYCGEKLEDK